MTDDERIHRLQQINRVMRRILNNVTPETSLQATEDLAAIGFTPQVGFLIVCRVLKDRQSAAAKET